MPSTIHIIRISYHATTWTPSPYLQQGLPGVVPKKTENSVIRKT